MRINNPFKIQEGSVRDGKVSGFIKQKKSGDYLDFSFLHKRESLGRFFSDRKIRFLVMVFLASLLILFGRAFYLQGVKGAYYRNIAEGNRIRLDVIKANRGLIYDRFGNPLVKNVSYFFLYIIPQAMPDDQIEQQKMLNTISGIVLSSPDEISSMIEDKRQDTDEVLIYENLDYQSAIQLMILSETYPAIKVNYEPRRQYFPELALSHVLGYLGQVSPEDIEEHHYNYYDRIGKSGLESVYERELKGQDGVRQIEVDALFREKSIISESEPVDGKDLVLTIDAKAQAKLAEIMNKYSVRYDKKKMAAVVMDAKDGGILAISNLPDYDNNIFTTVLNTEEYSKIIKDENKPLLNRVVSGAYPLGSVFKTIIGSAALEEGIIDTNFKVHSVGGISIGQSFFPDWRPGGHGWTDIYWAIADSVNTFFYSIGGGNNEWLSLGLGVDKIAEYAKEFGLGQPTGIDLDSEASGFLPTKSWKEDTFGERWYLGDTYNLSIGQGFMSATPLQAAQMMSYFANRGTAYKPHLIKELKDKDEIEYYQPEVALTNLISADNLDIIRRGLRMTVTDGTAQSLQSVSVPVAGKTGTAQFNRNKTPHSWMAAFAPYDDAKIVTVVLVEEGGDIGLAVSVTREFMEWYFSQ